MAEEELNYIDAICHYCEMNDIEVESVSKLMSKPLKERLKYDVEQLTETISTKEFESGVEFEEERVSGEMGSLSILARYFSYTRVVFGQCG